MHMYMLTWFTEGRGGVCMSLIASTVGVFLDERLGLHLKANILHARKRNQFNEFHAQMLVHIFMHKTVYPWCCVISTLPCTTHSLLTLGALTCCLWQS